jgi:hypothetical protein
MMQHVQLTSPGGLAFQVKIVKKSSEFNLISERFKKYNKSSAIASI